MGPFDCTLVLNPSLASVPDEALFWPTDRLRLALLFETVTDAKIVVRGIDPDVTDRSALVFRAELLATQKDRFVQAVASGLEPKLIPCSPVSNENRDAARPRTAEAQGDAIVITDPPGPGQGPKVYVLELPSSALATGTRG